MRQKLMQRRVKQTDGARKPRHHFKNRFEVGALFGQQFGKSITPPSLVIGQDHLAHCTNPRGIKEHMFSAA